MAERHGGTAGDSRLPRLGNVLYCPQGLDYFGNLDTDRMVANSDICAPFDPPMCSFRADPCDNQVGEMEVDGVGLYGQQVETTQEIVKHQEV